MLKFDHNKLKEKMKKVLNGLDFNEDSIFHVTNSLIETSLNGTDSHGINLFPHYINAIKSGRINSQPSFNFENRTSTTSVLDANNSIGHHSGAVAMQKAIQNAKLNGIGAVAVKQSSHFGAAAYFGLMAAEENCLGFAFTNADSLVKATNAKESFFGTNPICFTAPLLNEAPLCLDMATSLISWNKRNNFLREDVLMDERWAFDENGQSTTSPAEATSLRPIGDYKGFGLGMMVDILTSVLAGSLISKDILPMFSSDIKEKRNVGHFFMAIDIESFSDTVGFKTRLQSMVDRIRSMEKLNDEEVMVPGDPEKKAKLYRAENGIPVDSTKYDEFLGISDEFKECLKSE